MEARDEPQHRTQVNPCAGGFGLGECARQHDARYPTETETVLGAVAAGHSPSLPQEISRGPRLAYASTAVALAEATTRREAPGEVGSPHTSEEAG